MFNPQRKRVGVIRFGANATNQYGTCWRLPMLKQHGFVIYAGQAAFAKVLLRLFPMGAIGTSDVQRQIAAISDIVRH